MNLTSQTVTTGLSATVRPEAPSANKGTVGSTVASAHPLADVIYSVKATAAALGNTARLTIPTGVFAALVGSPVILRSGVDMQGNSLPALDKIHGIRITAPSGNSNAISCTTGATRMPQIYIDPGCSVAVSLPSAGVTLDSSTFDVEFFHAADSITIEVLGQTA